MYSGVRRSVQRSALLIDHVANIIVCMVNSSEVRDLLWLRRADALVRGYVVIVSATIVALAVLSVVDAAQATKDAWGHAVIVMLFAVLLPLRMRSARSGSRWALRAVGLIAAVLFLVNIVEALVPEMFPVWMRIEMIAIAVLMAAVVTCVSMHAARRDENTLADR
ncbi:hypothetical protein K7711_04200 [Nocardia sp. CA2R105]|uniref:hypothetical protein n=1 Tax=Nocardia coffeae TaxID=2873381 RepID=UPI001CA6471E|nr:hypothetical protein [Nocardia coffeae]MBY8855670.1 hypothetical protein [Nocardia coffeae]